MTCESCRRSAFALALGATAVSFAGAALGGPLAMVDPVSPTAAIFEPVLRDQLPSDDAQMRSESPARLRRQVVAYPTHEAPGTIVIDTANTYLYFVLGGGRAIRYGIGVGRDGFTWSGVQTVARKAEWPDWSPPAEMIRRQQYLPRWVAGGPGNPLGARAMYLGNSQYRVHGTNDPTSIGKKVSSGCIRLTNEDVIDLYARTPLGTKVVVLADGRRPANPESASLPVDRQPPQPQPSSSSPLPRTQSSRAFAFGLY